MFSIIYLSIQENIKYNSYSDLYKYTRIWYPSNDPINTEINALNTVLTSEKPGIHDLSLINIFELQPISLPDFLGFYCFGISTSGSLKNAIININTTVNVAEYENEDIVVSPILYNNGIIQNVTIIGSVKVITSQTNILSLVKGVISNSGNLSDSKTDLNYNVVYSSGLAASSNIYNQSNGGFTYTSGLSSQTQINSKTIIKTSIFVQNNTEDTSAKQHLIYSFISNTSNGFYKYYQLMDTRMKELDILTKDLTKLYYTGNSLQSYSSTSSTQQLIYSNNYRSVAIFNDKIYVCENNKVMQLQASTSAPICVTSCSSSGYILYYSLCVQTTIQIQNISGQYSTNTSKFVQNICLKLPALTVLVSNCPTSGKRQLDYKSLQITSTCQTNQYTQEVQCVYYCNQFQYSLQSSTCSLRTSAYNSSYIKVTPSTIQQNLYKSYYTLQPQLQGAYLDSNGINSCQQIMYNQSICTSITSYTSNYWFFYDSDVSKFRYYSCTNGLNTKINILAYQQSSLIKFNEAMNNISSTFKKYQCQTSSCSDQLVHSFTGICLNCTSFEGGQFIENSQCVSHCSSNKFVESNMQCSSQCSSQYYNIVDGDKICISNCNSPRFTANDTSISSNKFRCVDNCTEIPNFKQYQQTCVSNCPDGYLIIINNVCTNNCGTDKYVVNPGFDKCTDTCVKDNYDYTYVNQSNSVKHCLQCSDNYYANNSNSNMQCTQCINSSWYVHQLEYCKTQVCNLTINKFVNYQLGQQHCVQSCPQLVLQNDTNQQYYCTNNCEDGYSQQTIYTNIVVQLCKICENFKVYNQSLGQNQCVDTCPTSQPFINSTDSTLCIASCEPKYYQIMNSQNQLEANICQSGCKFYQGKNTGLLNHSQCINCQNGQQYVGYFNNQQICVDIEQCTYRYNISYPSVNTTCAGTQLSNKNDTVCKYYSSIDSTHYQCNNNCYKTQLYDGYQCVTTCVPKFKESSTSYKCITSCDKYYKFINSERVCINQCDISIPAENLGALFINQSVSSSKQQCSEKCSPATDYIYRQNNTCISSCNYINMTTTLNNQYICEQVNSSYCQYQKLNSSSNPNIYQCLKQCPSTDLIYDLNKVCSSTCSSEKPYVDGNKVCITKCNNKNYYILNTDNVKVCQTNCPIPNGTIQDPSNASMYQCKTCDNGQVLQLFNNVQKCIPISQCIYFESDRISSTYSYCYGTNESNLNKTQCPYYTKINTSAYECEVTCQNDNKFYNNVTKECLSACQNINWFISSEGAYSCVSTCANYYQQLTAGYTCVNTCTYVIANGSYSNDIWECSETCPIPSQFIQYSTLKCVDTCNYQNITETRFCETQNDVRCKKYQLIDSSNNYYKCLNTCITPFIYDNQNVCDNNCHNDLPFIQTNTSTTCSASCSNKNYYYAGTNVLICNSTCSLPNAIGNPTNSVKKCFLCSSSQAVNAVSSNQECIDKNSCKYIETDGTYTNGGQNAVCFGTSDNNRDTKNCTYYTLTNSSLPQYECGACSKYYVQTTNECVQSCYSKNLFLNNNICVAECDTYYQYSSTNEPTCVSSCQSPKVLENTTTYTQTKFECKSQCSSDLMFINRENNTCIINCQYQNKYLSPHYCETQGNQYCIYYYKDTGTVYQCIQSCQGLYPYENYYSSTNIECTAACKDSQFYSENNKSCNDVCSSKKYNLLNNYSKQCISSCNLYQGLNTTATNLGDHYQCVSSCDNFANTNINNGTNFCVTQCNQSSEFKYLQGKMCQKACNTGNLPLFFDQMTCISCAGYLVVTNTSINQQLCVKCEAQQYIQFKSVNYTCINTQPDSNMYKFSTLLASENNCSQYLNNTLASQNLTTYKYQDDKQCLTTCIKYIMPSTLECINSCGSLGFQTNTSDNLKYCADCNTISNGVYIIINGNKECQVCSQDNFYVHELQCKQQVCDHFYQIQNQMKYCADNCSYFVKLDSNNVEYCTDECQLDGYTKNMTNQQNYCISPCATDNKYINSLTKVKQVGQCFSQCPETIPYVEKDSYICINTCSSGYYQIINNIRKECKETCKLPEAIQDQSAIIKLCYNCSSTQFVTNISISNSQSCVDSCVYFSEQYCYGTDQNDSYRNKEVCKMYIYYNETSFQCQSYCSNNQLVANNQCVNYCPQDLPFYWTQEKVCDNDCNGTNYYYKNYNVTYNGQNYSGYECINQCAGFEYNSIYNNTEILNTSLYCADKCPQNLSFWNRYTQNCVSTICTYLNITISDRYICESNSGNEYCPKIEDYNFQGSNLTNKCVTTCSEGFYDNNNKCIAECQKPNYFHDRTSRKCTNICEHQIYEIIESKYYCLDQCEHLSGLDEIQGQLRCVEDCSDMKINIVQQDTTCQKECNLGYYNTNNVCNNFCDQDQNYYIDYTNNKSCIDCQYNQNYIFNKIADDYCLQCQPDQLLAIRNKKFQCVTSCNQIDYQFTEFIEESSKIHLCSESNCSLTNELYPFLEFLQYNIQQSQISPYQCIQNCSLYLETNNECKTSCENFYYYINKNNKNIKTCNSCLDISNNIYQLQLDKMKLCYYCEQDNEYVYMENNTRECNTTQCKDSLKIYIQIQEENFDNQTSNVKICQENCTFFAMEISNECVYPCEGEGYTMNNLQHICMNYCEAYIDPSQAWQGVPKCVETCTAPYLYMEDNICKTECENADYYVTNGQLTTCEEECNNYKWQADGVSSTKYNCSSICPADKPYPDLDKFCHTSCTMMKESYEIVVIDPASGMTEQIVTRTCIDECDAMVYKTTINNIETYVCVEPCPNGNKFVNKITIPQYNNSEFYECADTCTTNYYQYIQHPLNEDIYLQICTTCDDAVVDPNESEIKQCTSSCSSIRPDLQFYIIAQNGTKICVTQCGPQYTHIAADGKCTNKCEENRYEIVSSGVTICSNECGYYIKSYKPQKFDSQNKEIFQCVYYCDGKLIGNRCYAIGEIDWDWGTGGGNGC